MANVYVSSGKAAVGQQGKYVPAIYKEMRDPTIYDWQNFNLMDEWLNQITDNWFKLVSLERISAGPGSQATWVQVSGGGSGGVGSWVDVTGTTQVLAVNTGYTTDNVGLVTLTLPSVAAYGSIIRVVGKGSGGWLISQSAGQVIHLGSVNTTSGVTGSLSSSQQYDTVELLCTVTNTDFTVANGPQGNLIVI